MCVYIHICVYIVDVDYYDPDEEPTFPVRLIIIIIIIMTIIISIISIIMIVILVITVVV